MKAAGDPMSIGPLLRQRPVGIARRNLWFIVAIVGDFCRRGRDHHDPDHTPKYTAQVEHRDFGSDPTRFWAAVRGSNDAANNWDIDRFLATQATILKSRALVRPAWPEA